MYNINLHKQQFIDKPIAEVFKFFQNPNNLQMITPPNLDFEILSKCPKTMTNNLIIDYRIKLFKIPFNWKTKINLYNPPLIFIDEQLKGPYKKWVHTHTFKEYNGGTIINDEVEYIVPFGALGFLANSIWIKFELNRVFEYRHKIINSYFNNVSYIR